MAKKKAAKAGDEKGPKKPPTKSEFLRKALTRNPNLDHDQLNKRWAKAGHTGEISKPLYYNIRHQLGIKTVWEWVYTGPPVEVPAAGLPKTPSGATQARALGEVFQFKITLQDVEPPIWRRIQVEDGTLDSLHQHIQTAMGWTNSHLHQFHIGDARYAPPSPYAGDLDDMGTLDSTKILLNSILPKDGKPFVFGYEYDFGDGWMHDVEFEGRSPADPKKEYPLCLAGERACPPEDCGGAWGYVDFLEAISDREHEQHQEMREWIGGKFDPEKFAAPAATRRMRQGLPRW